MSDDQSVVVSEIALDGGLRLGHATLNVESTLNSLSLEMIHILHPALVSWASDDSIAGVVITAAGEKAFCAGGDIQALYRCVSANHKAGEVVDDYAFRFFEEEYRLDYYIHTYPKPLLTLGHGIVMGGGLGIFGASEFRIVTEKSRLAVPEVTIGLFPDAGASWALNNMEPHHAAFLALTGSHLNAADALLTRLATHAIGHDERDAWLGELGQQTWQGQGDTDRAMLTQWMSQRTQPNLADSQVAAVPARQINYDDLAGEVAAIQALAGTSAWIDRGISNLTNGCPTTAGIILEQLKRVAGQSLADAFRMELTVATHCANNPDFAEGVRALLIDKDNTPAWRYSEFDSLPKSYVLSHFEPPWSEHPLKDLG